MIRSLVAVVAIGSVCAGGCATATIARTDGPDNEAVITRSDPDNIYLLARNGIEYPIERRSVAAIDHPGNVELLVGGIILGFVGLALGASGPQGRRELAIPVGVVYGAPGLFLTLHGGMNYYNSVAASRDFENAQP